MRITSELGGFSLAEADIMRRIMGKKKKSEMQVQKDKFIKGCIENNIDQKIAQAIADMIEKFASYGFNKSHAAAYALIAYQTAYLKSNYSAEFMAANLSSEVNNTDRIVALIEECRKMGIEVVPPDINYSQSRFEPLNKNKIAFGLAAIKNVGLGAIKSILEGRKDCDYKSIFELMQHVDLRLVNKKVLESLVQSGAMDSLQGNRAQNFHALETAIEFGQDFQGKKRRNHSQRSLFDMDPQVNDIITYPKLPDVPDWKSQEKLMKEKEVLGFYITGHPLQKFANVVNLYRTTFNVSNGQETAEGNGVNICGMITEIRTLLDRKENKMAFVKVEDFNRTYEAVVFGSVYPQIESRLKKDALVLLHGRLNSSIDEPVIKIICEDVFELERVPEAQTDYLMLRGDKSKMTSEKITYLKNTLYKGKKVLIVVVQRVSSASVRINQELVGEIGNGLVLLIGVAETDTESDVSFVANKCATLRIFQDDQGKLNRSVLDEKGAILAISQFTLLGDTRKGRRPNFTAAASPEKGKKLYEYFVECLNAYNLKITSGVFGAMMDVSLTNVGPVTILVQSKNK
jgi:DNA polymerase-3 subunit alpha